MHNWRRGMLGSPTWICTICPLLTVSRGWIVRTTLKPCRTSVKRQKPQSGKLTGNDVKTGPTARPFFLSLSGRSRIARWRSSARATCHAVYLTYSVCGGIGVSLSISGVGAPHWKSSIVGTDGAAMSQSRAINTANSSKKGVTG